MEHKKKCFVVTGGGTGGHIYPAIAIGRGLQSRFPGCTVYYVGGKRGLENTIVPREGLPLFTVHSQGWERRFNWRMVSTAWTNVRGVAEAFRLLKKLRPDVVIGTGGFVAFPVVLAATLAGIPALLHEQNAYPGIANRLLASRADSVLLTFPAARKHLPACHTVVTGLPVRPNIVAASRDAARQFFQLPAEAQVLLVVGGSRGARRLNEVIVPLAGRWAGKPRYQLLLVTGEANYSGTRELLAAAGICLADSGNIRVMPYIDRMDQALAASDLCIGRAGAAFLAEITVRGLPAVLVPYPYATENHQEANARSLEAAGAARVILERELDGDCLRDLVISLFAQPVELGKMARAAKAAGQKNALVSIVAEVERVLTSRR
ncbi:MAG: undecaprenyldiphospho-muramoylpentapeptide beta-N-acetylglucosaminyltransferase [Heliobacteriaceae bacterium]|nr:undecaprenyldiphospho-muramoylpentapeptide beta-N-acetylglucosaminyltransferase [Heliobacteriaceae bacterium]MDD4588077.1 undecaprenyldiphospho-muramoylpentapeptide beta-N-acetylglucosaminyltransferase [Heliobacteriaceae bacterium]